MTDSINKKPETLEFIDILRQKIRVRIVTLLYENIELSYTELLNMLDIDEGLLNFHLRKIKKFLKITEKRTYMLSDYGKIAHEVLLEIDKKTKTYGLAGITETPKNHLINQQFIARRVISFILDISIIMMSSGVLFESSINQTLIQIYQSKIPFFSFPQFTHEIILIYSNVVIASFIIFTVLEAYKGQTIGKYIMGIRVEKINGRKISLMDSAVRNIGKIFFLPFDLILGIALHRKEGYIRFFGYYTETKIVKVSTH